MNDTPDNQTNVNYQIVDASGIVRRLWAKRGLVALGCVVGAILGYGVALLIPPAFDAVVRLMPPEKKDTSLLASLSPTRNEGDIYLGLISSRTVADDVIQSLNLTDYFHTSKPSELRAHLAAMAKIEVDKNQFITVTVRAREPEMAVKIANQFPLAVDRLSRTIALSQSTHRWEFFAGPLELEKTKLAAAEDALKDAEQKTGIVMPAAQIQLGLSSISALKTQITSRQEQLAALETSSTNQNPDVIQLKSQISSLSAELGRLQAQNGGSNSSTASAKLPGLTLDVERLTREVKFHEALFQVLSRQYENARVDDSYSPQVELVDAAVLPDRKSWPPRALFAIVGLLIGLLTASAFAGLRR